MEPHELLEALVVLDDLQDAVEQDNDPPRVFLRKEDAFGLADAKFIKFFRVNKELAEFLIDLLGPFLMHPTRRSGLSVETKVQC